MLTLRVRNPDGSLGVELNPDDWSGSLLERDTIPSTLQVTGPSSLMESCYLTNGVEDWTRGIFMDDDQGARFSGVLTEVLYGPVETTCTWDSDRLRFWERIVYPNPAQAWQAQTTDYWLHASAPAETVGLDLIAAQLGPAAGLTYRRNAITVPASQGRGTARPAKLRFDNVGRWLADLGEATGLRFDVIHQQGAAIPTVTVRQTLNRTVATAPAVPAIYGSAGSGGPGRLADDSWQIRVGVPTVTASLAAGGGLGSARLLRERPGTPDNQGWRRVEVLNDQNGITVAAELDEASDEDLAAGANPVEITGVSILESPGLILGRDVRLGDIVGADLGRFSITDRVRVITSTIANGRTSVLGAIGSPDAGLTRTQKDYLKQRRTIRKVQS